MTLPLEGFTVVALEQAVAMGDVPALGRHTIALLREAGLTGAEIDEALTAGTAWQAPV